MHMDMTEGYDIDKEKQFNDKNSVAHFEGGKKDKFKSGCERLGGKFSKKIDRVNGMEVNRQIICEHGDKKLALYGKDFSGPYSRADLSDEKDNIAAVDEPNDVWIGDGRLSVGKKDNQTHVALDGESELDQYR